jgi:hypothetical protein
MPFSCRGTGISFKPATSFAHSSNEPVLPLGTGITFDQPLSLDHEINSVIRNEKVTSAGYQGIPSPNQWFGGPAFSTRAGNMILRDANGNVVDGLNYGLIVDPWSAEGYHGTSGTGESGCKAPVPGMISGSGFSSTPRMLNMSVGRYPDGDDNDSNCSDFLVQKTTTILTASAAGSDNIKVANVSGFKNGQKIIIDNGTNKEIAIIAIIGTGGGTKVGTSTKAGETIITVEGLEGFSAGQTITIDNGGNRETAVIASLTPARGRVGRPNYIPTNSITVTAPLTKIHNSGAEVSGSGITLSKPITRAHNPGVQIASDLPTPGEPNNY